MKWEVLGIEGCVSCHIKLGWSGKETDKRLIAMGKKEKTGLGRSLVKQHNHMIEETKEKGRIYKKKFLESFTEVTDIDTIIEQSENPEFQSDLPGPTTLASIWIQYLGLLG
ncbi:hypothetical protein Lalb_Chr19g0136201 [Lupinus albus]|uniref:Uncharacterized protein n=1 Tax=Lupinus albus TaxID=3870 RepID=A0A6A4P0H3_LUPAL|nr:hypothetical protein Lalb_Chr19g0136201 [Lupinus albus]